jgi:Integrase core domain
VKFRQKWYTSLADLQGDLDAWLGEYNTLRLHQGYRTQGRTPLRAFEDALTTGNEEMAPAA